MALLLLGCLAHEVEAAEDAAAERHRQIGAAIGNLLGDDRHVDGTPAEPAIGLRERHGEEPRLDPLVVKLVRVGLLAVEPTDVFGRGVLVPSACARSRAAASARR